MGFFRGKGANVLLMKHDDGVILAFVVVGEKWKDPRVLNSLETIVRDVAPTLGGLPVEMRLVNAQLEIEKIEVIGDEDGQ